MLTKIKNVYYCEHCGRHRLTPNSIKKHEPGCTLNHDRVCGVCEERTGLAMPELLAKYKDRFVVNEGVDGRGYYSRSSEWTREPITLNELRDDTEGCPVCMLAVIRQCDLNNSPGDFSSFRYQEEHKEYWDERNAACSDEMRYYLV